MTARDTALRHLREVLAVNHSPFLGSDGIRPCLCAIHEAARAALSAPSTEASGEGNEAAKALAPARRGGRRRLTFDNGRHEDYDSVFVQHSGGEWDRILIARDDGTIAQLIADLINAAATDPSHPTASDPLDIRFHDERRAEVAEMVAEGDANADDGLMGPDGLADGLLTLAEGWVRASLASHPTAEPGLVPFAIRIGEALRDMDGAKLEAESEGYQNMEWRQWSPDEIGKELAARLLREPSA